MGPGLVRRIAILASRRGKSYQSLPAAGLEDAATAVVPAGHKRGIVTAFWAEVQCDGHSWTKSKCDSLTLAQSDTAS